MLNLAGDKVVLNSFLKTLWLQRLPVNMHSIISVSGEDLAKVATMADKIWELNPITPQIGTISFNDENTIADTLSRIDIISVPSVIDLQTIANSQKDEELEMLIKIPSLKILQIPIPDSNKKIYCDISTNYNHPYIPTEFRQKIFSSIHNLSHSGIRSTTKLIDWLGVSYGLT
ncbi:hypothetical protein NPIL_339931 [Nephila pilipes]|uniref:Uncharacterized protein n=1 Tax=Nephila pilipes TaxID=299642 RepID=A0A8X6NUV6_NEPPI|nr:hypothetical protein NPIL_339931 [Nephila pilipes]